MKENRQNAAEAGASKIHFVFANRLTGPSRGPRRRRRPRLRTGTKTATYASRATPCGRCNEDSDEQAWPPLSRAGASTRNTATAEFGIDAVNSDDDGQ